VFQDRRERSETHVTDGVGERGKKLRVVHHRKTVVRVLLYQRRRRAPEVVSEDVLGLGRPVDLVVVRQRIPVGQHPVRPDLELQERDRLRVHREVGCVHLPFDQRADRKRSKQPIEGCFRSNPRGPCSNFHTVCARTPASRRPGTPSATGNAGARSPRTAASSRCTRNRGAPDVSPMTAAKDTPPRLPRRLTQEPRKAPLQQGPCHETTTVMRRLASRRPGSGSPPAGDSRAPGRAGEGTPTGNRPSHRPGRRVLAAAALAWYEQRRRGPVQRALTRAETEPPP
jgi:hypothetical protein